MAIVLASSSPRRQQLLEQLGCKFSIITSNFTEDNSKSIPPRELAVFHAREKAWDVALRVERHDVVIGADTIVVLEGQVYGKPLDAIDAKRMLTNLSGKTHQVITGIAVVRGAEVWTDSVITQVRIAQLEVKEIERYAATGEPLDKAGAYAIQGIGAQIVESINGCYSNVVGLPLNALTKLLKKAGVCLL